MNEISTAAFQDANSKKTILIVDDEPLNISVLKDLLKNDYRLVAARTGRQALERAFSSPAPDLVLLDVMMPEMDGYEVCRRLKNNEMTQEIPVIFVSALNQAEDETKGLDLGAADYIMKPISPAVVLSRIRNHLSLRDAQIALQQQNGALEDMVADRTTKVNLTRDAAILCMTSLAETRDNETGNHIRRTQHYVREIALALNSFLPEAERLSAKFIDLLFKSAPLHDIGKIGIPDSILLKPGKLSDEEFEIMKKHAEIGVKAIENAELTVSDEEDNTRALSFLRVAKEIIGGHHERWDGKGYPAGVGGTEIPVSARLMAVADVYDALVSARVYKKAFPHEKAVSIIVEGRGTQFDPMVVDAFLTVTDRMDEIARRFADHCVA